MATQKIDKIIIAFFLWRRKVSYIFDFLAIY